MNKIDYMVYVAKSMHDMREMHFKYKYDYDKKEKQEIFKNARKISRYSKINVEESKYKINENNIFSTFLSSLEILDSKKIIDFYKEYENKIKIVRQRCVEEDEAVLEYLFDDKKEISAKVNLPKTSLTVTNQLGFSHEMGHIPEIVLPRFSFFEYSETLPMFFEYLTALKCYKKDAKDNFIYGELSMIIDDAISLTRLYSKSELKQEVQKMYFTQQFAEVYSFLESFDYTLQLMDLFEEDKSLVANEIEKIISGKSLIDVADDLSIDSTGCKRLLKEYKNEVY